MSILGFLARTTEPRRVWFKWPFTLGLGIILGHRENLREGNLTDTETAPPQLDRPSGIDIVGARTADGSFNDLGKPWMGMAGTRFGRNVPLKDTYGESAPELFEPSPRLISNRLLARTEFTPVPHLNSLAAAWIQFMVHDWLSHGKNDASHVHEIPLPDGDGWDGKMTIPRTMPDGQTNDDDAGKPATFRNVETHWWDASQIYGSSAERVRLVRTGGAGRVAAHGKIALRDGKHLPIDTAAAETNLELAGVNGNWWIGLSVLHTIFAREHNAVVDRLRIDYPDATGDWLFDKARLVVAALTAKIHTVEWTPALMDSPIGRMAMRGNYWGLVGERGRNTHGRLSDSEVISGIMGSPQDHHGAPYAMTEEFAAVYRLHSLLPDHIEFRRFSDDSPIVDLGLDKIGGGQVGAIYEQVDFDDVLYSMATTNPGALVLHNFPNALRDLTKQGSTRKIDLAAIDILRDRERGVPRFKEFRRLTGMTEPQTFADITSNETWQQELKEVYGTVDKVDLLVGTLAESVSENGQPPRFGFSDTAFRIFILMASRRLKSDRFFTDDFRPEIYTPAGFDWVTQNTLQTVITRHAPALASAYGNVRNLFFPWARSGE